MSSIHKQLAYVYKTLATLSTVAATIDHAKLNTPVAWDDTLMLINAAGVLIDQAAVEVRGRLEEIQEKHMEEHVEAGS